ncbi:MAG TPA: hypothetical protein VMR98_01205, partial [Candidatus Polarisedimenticolaceae bacterium]|nr:hypothetical protein [Candidatus Polarisedimenticolaceae bacterium]
FAVAIFGESLSWPQLLGFILVLVSSMLLSLDREAAKFKLNSAFFLIIIANIFFAIGAVLVKLTVNVNGFTTVLAYESWGAALGGLVLYAAFAKARHAFHDTLKTAGRSVLSIMFVNEVLFLVAKSLMFYAILLGPLAIVSVLGSAQVFYGILYGTVLTLAIPKLFKEDITPKAMARKVTLSAILVFGIWLLS